MILRLIICVQGESRSSFVYCVSELNISTNICSGNAAMNDPFEVQLSKCFPLDKPDGALARLLSSALKEDEEFISLFGLGIKKKVQERPQVLRYTTPLITL